VSSDKRTMWIQATVLVLLAGLGYVMVGVYARGWNHAAAVADGGADGQVVNGGPPGATTRAQVKQLHDALRKKLGTNARGLSRVASVDYDGWPDRLVVVFALDHNPMTMTPAQAAELRPMRDVLEAVHGAGLTWGWVMLCGTAPLEGPGKEFAETTVVRAQFTRGKLDKVKWGALEAAALPQLADSFTVEPELAVLRPESKPAATKPVTRPAVD
jgi:hypothetical protein